jgi:D-alanyl-D-alanine carboxypeptidase (penicillin-binding protein 5/6)
MVELFRKEGLFDWPKRRRAVIRQEQPADASIHSKDARAASAKTPYRRRRRKRRKRRRAMWAVVFLAVVIGIVLVTFPNDTPAVPPSVGNDSHTPTPGAISALTPEPAEETFDASGLLLNSSHAILLSLHSGQTLYEKHASERVYPASLTKIMTALVVLDTIADRTEMVTLAQRIFDETLTQNASVAGFLPGERVSVEDLLYGLMLPSGAECALGLAEYAAGSEAAFAERMNKKAEELHMDGTYFVNATGLHDQNQYTTVLDIAILLDHALEYETFYQIFTAHRYTVNATNKHTNGLTFYSTLFSKTSGEYSGFRLLGGKTGYTAEAGQCLASLAEADGQTYILVTCGAPGDNRSQTLHMDDMVAVYAAMQGREQIELRPQRAD